MVYLQRCLIVTWLVPRETAAVSARSVYTLSRHFVQRYIRKVYACLAVSARSVYTLSRHFVQRYIRKVYACLAVSARSVYTLSRHFVQRYIRKVYACLAVTCHLYLWQNDRNLLRATAVTRGWNGYRNKSGHRKLTLEKKILPQLLPGLEPATF